jgi:hypothetical protein
MSQGNLRSDQRHRIVKDITEWWLESKRTGGESPSGAELQDYIDELRDQENERLIEMWHSTVGEWLSSRDDLRIPDDMSHEAWVESQLSKLKSGDTRGYTFDITVILDKADP